MTFNSSTRDLLSETLGRVLSVNQKTELILGQSLSRNNANVTQSDVIMADKGPSRLQASLDESAGTLSVYNLL